MQCSYRNTCLHAVTCVITIIFLIILFVWPWKAKIVNEIEIWLTPQLYHMPSRIIPLLNICVAVIWQRQKEEWSLVRAACAHRIHLQPWSVVDLRWFEPGPLRCCAMGLTARDLTLPLKCFGLNTNIGWLQTLHVTWANLKVLSWNDKYALKWVIQNTLIQGPASQPDLPHSVTEYKEWQKHTECSHNYTPSQTQMPAL